MSEIDTDASAASSTGLDPRHAAVLAYLAGPFSACVVLLAERNNRFVRFHAWQSILGLGTLAAAAILLLLSAFLGLFLSPSLFRTLYILAGLTAVLWLIVWALCVVNALKGAAWKLPLIGDRAARRS